MRTSISITNYTCPGGATAMAGYLRDLAQSADETGIDTVWVADHLLQADPAARLDDPMLERHTRRWDSSRPRRAGCGSAPWSRRSRSGHLRCC